MSLAIPKYSKNFTITYRDVDMNGQLRMSSLVDYMQEISGEHARLLGMDYKGDDASNEDQVYWIVSRAKMTLETIPNWLETIRIETYPNGVDKLFAVRMFDIFDQEDKQIGQIIGDYILMDCKTHRPIRISQAKGPLRFLNRPYEGELLEKLRGPEEVVVEDKRKVRSNEIDLNHHMNNAHYIRWTVDMFTTEELRENPIKSIQTNYTASLTEGDTAILKRGPIVEGKCLIEGTSVDGKVSYWTSEVTLMEA